MKSNENVDYKKIIGKRILDFRKFIRKTQKEIADESEAIGISFSPEYISQIEHGKRDCHSNVFVALHLLYNANIDYFFSGKGAMILAGDGKKDKTTVRSLEEITREVDILLRSNYSLQSQINILKSNFNESRIALKSLIAPIDEAYNATPSGNGVKMMVAETQTEFNKK